MTDQPHNDPLEEFFRKKVQEYNVEYHEEDWQKLEQKLDSYDKEQAYHWKRYLAAAAVVLLFGILAYITYQQQQRINQLNERLTDNQQLVDPQTPFWEIVPNDLFDFTPSPNVVSDSTHSSGVESNSPATLAADTTDKKETSEYKVAQTNEQQRLGLKESKKVLASAGLVSTDLNASLSTNEIRGIELSVNDISSQKNNVTGSAQSFNSTQPPVSIDHSSRMTVGIIGGPDISTVGGLSDFYSPGYKLGVSLEYKLSKNLAISVGAIHSKVQYQASGNEYSPPSDYWSYGQTPTKATGQCYLIDIPISLKYNFYHFDNSRFYMTGGLSSYMMLNEDYRFEYEGYGTNQPQRWQEHTGTRYWMNNAVVSVGYEMDLKNSLSIRFEPFLKVPVKEVGWANVKLYSLGSFISLNYNIF